jgi:magnesium transporter
MIGNLLRAELEEMIAKQKWDELRESLAVLDPPDIAEIIVDLPAEDEGVIFRVLPRERAALVFSYLPVEQQEALLHSLSSETSKTILESMSPDDRARLLEEVPAEVTRLMLEKLSPEELKITRQILGYPEHTAGRYMTPEYVSLRPEWTAGEALEHIRKTGKAAEQLAIVYVIDETGHLRSEIRLATLVMVDVATKVGAIDDRPLVSLLASSPRHEIVETFEKYDRVAVPVTDKLGHMLGIITVDDVLDVAEQEATESMQKMGGNEALDAPYLSMGFWPMVKKRAGWLAILFLGEMLTATAMGHFEGEIERAAIVALFVPLIISSGGNSGSQGTSLIIRSLALRELKLADWWKVFGRELRTGLALGLILGLIGFARIAAWQGLSQTPIIGGFFRTHSSESQLIVPPGMKASKEEVNLDSDLKIAEGYVIPKGSAIVKDQLLPENLEVKVRGKDGKARDLEVRLHNASISATAYGEHWMLIGYTVFFALIGVVCWGSLAGSMLPFILRRLGFDPATSSAPFVATLVDVTGLIIYFGVAKIILTGTLL